MALPHAIMYRLATFIHISVEALSTTWHGWSCMSTPHCQSHSGKGSQLMGSSEFGKLHHKGPYKHKDEAHTHTQTTADTSQLAVRSNLTKHKSCHACMLQHTVFSTTAWQQARSPLQDTTPTCYVVASINGQRKRHATACCITEPVGGLLLQVGN